MSDSFESPKYDMHISLPQPLQADLTDPQCRLTGEDIETLLAVRNVFAFLANQPLVATPKYSSVFSIFLRIADILQRYDFSNIDGSTLGEEVETSFRRVIDEFRLGDVRTSREKTVEAVVLGERMRSWELYNEGFVHLAGKHDEVVKSRERVWSVLLWIWLLVSVLCGQDSRRLNFHHFLPGPQIRRPATIARWSASKNGRIPLSPCGGTSFNCTGSDMEHGHPVLDRRRITSKRVDSTGYCS